MSEKKEKIAYSVVAGELRKAAKLFQVFERASELADILGDFSKEQKSIENTIAALTQEKEELDKKCDEAYARRQKHEGAAVRSRQEAEKVLSDAREEYKRILSDARVSADKVLKENEKEIADLKAEIAGLKQTIEVLHKEKAIVEKEVVSVKNYLSQMRDKLFTAMPQE